MTADLHNLIKGAIEGINNDEKKWHQRTIQDVAAAVHTEVANELATRDATIATLNTSIEQLQAQIKDGVSDAAVAERLTALESEKADLETKVANATDAATEAHDALKDFFTALAAGTDVNEALADLADSTGNPAPEPVVAPAAETGNGSTDGDTTNAGDQSSGDGASTDAQTDAPKTDTQS